MKTNKYLNLINTNDEQEQLYSSYTYDKSYIDYTVENKKVHYAQPFFHKVGKVGDFYYENGLFSRDIILKRGIPIGIVVIEENFIPTSPQGRIMSLVDMNYSTPTTGGTYTQGMYWGNYENTIPLQYYDEIAHCGYDNTISSFVQGLTNSASLPSDSFSAKNYSGDPSTYYANSNYHAISPYLTDASGNTTFNTEYIKTTSPSSSANCLSDLDGYGNTEVLTNDTYTSGQSDWKTANTITNNSAAGYSPAACCCKRFEVGGLDWYLPSMGEIGFIMPRFSVIQSQLTKLINNGGSSYCHKLETNGDYWSSTQVDDEFAMHLGTYDCHIYKVGKADVQYYVRAFCLY